MKEKYRFLLTVINGHCENLFNLQDESRYEAIKKLSNDIPDFMCIFYKHCNRCPLFIKNPYGSGLCSDVASDKEVYTLLSSGGRFLTKEECKNEA